MSFSRVSSVAEATKLLNVSVEALRCARALPTRCKKAGCANPALEHNHNMCACHRSAWWPTTGKCGSLLLGQSFMYCKQAGATNKQVCCCGSVKCRAIGYCGKGAFVLPVHPVERHAYYDAVSRICAR